MVNMKLARARKIREKKKRNEKIIWIAISLACMLGICGVFGALGLFGVLSPGVCVVMANILVTTFGILVLKASKRHGGPI